MSIDFEALTIGPSIDAFGVPYTYIPQLAPRFNAHGIFMRAYSMEAIKEGVVVTETMPVLGIKESDFPNPPLQGDVVVIAGEAFKVREFRPDHVGAGANAGGGGKLMLNYYTDYPNL